MEPGGKPLERSKQGSDLDFKTLRSRARVKMEDGLECGRRVEAPVKNELENGNVHSLMEREVWGQQFQGWFCDSCALTALGPAFLSTALKTVTRSSA